MYFGGRSDNTSATIQPIRVQPSNRLSQKMPQCGTSRTYAMGQSACP